MKLSISELSDLTGFDRRRIRKELGDLKAEQGPKSAILYESTEALPVLYMGEGEHLDANKERARLTHHQANLAELDERTKRGELVPMDTVVSEVSEACSNMRAKLLNLPPKMAAVVVAMDDLHEVQTVLESGVVEALAELHTQYVDNEQGGGSAEAPTETEG